MTIGSFTFVLHSHLPYVLAHGRWPHGLDWLNEVCAESYIPLLDVLYQLVEEGHSPKLTIGITPVLTEQLIHKSFKRDFMLYLNQKIEAAKEDEAFFKESGLTYLSALARQWQSHYNEILIHFDSKYNQNLAEAFRKLQDDGHIEIITSAATHGYLPLLGQDTSIQMQIKQGISTYKKWYGRKPRGFWLPECAYRPSYKWAQPFGPRKATLRKGIEEFLSENDIDYFIVDTHLVKGGKTQGVYIHRFKALKDLWRQFEKSYKPEEESFEKTAYEVYLVGQPNRKPVAVFARDPITGIQVWSGEHGYPADGWYLDFHKKRFPGGHRYWRVTSAKIDLSEKMEYDPDKVKARLEENASHFKEVVKGTLKSYNESTGKRGILCAPYDTELFGHWWFEGPRWLYLVLKWMDLDTEIELTTCSEYLDNHPPTTLISLPEGSWGQGGFHWIWLNDWTTWTWRYIYETEKKMQSLASRFGETEDKDLQQILKQAARELFLLQSSDWQFLISTWSARDYAEARVTEHYNDFERLATMAVKYALSKELTPDEWDFLKHCEKKDDIFADINPMWFAKMEF